jgi:transcriptional regulator of aromatic amino acid metabolism
LLATITIDGRQVDVSALVQALAGPALRVDLEGEIEADNGGKAVRS